MLRFIPRNPSPVGFPRPEGMPEALHALLAARGIDSAEAAERFLHPDGRSLVDPARLWDMAPATQRIRAALAAGDAICVYGDYDVDGVCASAILSGWLNENGGNARVYLPSRHHEGYGLNEAAVREIAGWAKLLVTVDCGVTSAELVALAKELGLDVVVTDHHEPGDRLPDCPVVNPLLGGYPCPQLCGAGVAWKLVWALGGEAAAMARVDIAALATVADVVALTGENRAIVHMGLQRLNDRPRPGVAALIASAGLSGKPITAASVAFQLAPRLNAGGRLGSAERALKLIMAPDAAQAAPLAEALERENLNRRGIEQAILAEAEAQLSDFDFPAHRALILAGKDWNPGVIGLAASRLAEKYHYPVVMLADQGERMTGSCRSIPGVDIHAALAGCADTLERFGGHRQAAGLTLLPGRLEDFRRAMDAWLEANVDPLAYIPVQEYDAGIGFDAVTPELIAALEAMQPTGFGNPAPVFRAAASVVDARAVGAEGAHLKLTLSQGGRRLDGIAFRQGARAESLGGAVDALFTPRLNAFMGRVTPELEVRALAETDVFRRIQAKLGDEGRLRCEFLTEVFYNKTIDPKTRPAEETDLETVRSWMGGGIQGTLVLTADLAMAARLMKALEGASPDLTIGRMPEDPRCFNAVCAYPPARQVPRGYRRVVLAGMPGGCPAYAPGAATYRLPGAPGWVRSLPELEDMRAAYRALMRVGQRPAWCRSPAQLARVVADEAGLEDVGALASILAMADMGLFQLEIDGGEIRIRRSASRAADPEQSAVWRAICRWRAEETARQ